MFRPDLLAGRQILTTGNVSELGGKMGRRFFELGARLAFCGPRCGRLSTGRW
jgi:short-subunit dehydrogenase involved in D-alanine esterification of teichoic acids